MLDKGPYAISWHVIDLLGDRGHNAKVVASALHRPKQVGLGPVSRHGSNLSISSHNFQGNEVICDEAVASLQVSMATTESGSEESSAVTDTGHFGDD